MNVCRPFTHTLDFAQIDFNVDMSDDGPKRYPTTIRGACVKCGAIVSWDFYLDRKMMSTTNDDRPE